MDPNKKTLEVSCPGCGKKTPYEDNPHRPFCSERCRLVDLGQWADGEYRIPERTVDPDELDRLREFSSRDERN